MHRCVSSELQDGESAAATLLALEAEAESVRLHLEQDLAGAVQQIRIANRQVLTSHSVWLGYRPQSCVSSWSMRYWTLRLFPFRLRDVSDTASEEATRQRAESKALSAEARDAEVLAAAAEAHARTLQLLAAQRGHGEDRADCELVGSVRAPEGLYESYMRTPMRTPSRIHLCFIILDGRVPSPNRISP